MKKATLIIATALTMAFGCSKEKQIEQTQSSTPTALSSSGDFLSFTTSEYEDIKKRLETEFNPLSTNAKPTEPSNGYKKLTADYKPEVEPEAVYNTRIINFNNSITNKFPELKNHNSMLSIYNHALTLTDKEQLKSLCDKYNYFLVYVPELKAVVLKIPLYKAALLSPIGAIGIDNKIHVYSSQYIKIIKNGDKELLKNIANITASIENIQVIQTQTSLSKIIEPKGVVVHSHPVFPQFQMLINKYIDYFLPVVSYYTNINYNTYVQAISYHNSSPAAGQNINVASYTYFNEKFEGSNWGGGFYTFTATTYPTLVPNSAPLATGLTYFRIQAGWDITYANGARWIGQDF